MVFYHTQAYQGFKENGELYLNWQGNGQEIINIANKIGLWTKWDGSEDTKILVKA